MGGIGFWRVYLALPGCAEVKEDNVARVSAASLSKCVDTCRTKNKDDAKYLACVTVCENDFLLGDGNTVAPDVNGGKVFSDTAGVRSSSTPWGAKCSAQAGSRQPRLSPAAHQHDEPSRPRREGSWTHETHGEPGGT